MNEERIAILGASRGLGSALVDHILAVRPQSRVLAISRRMASVNPEVISKNFDFSAAESLPALLETLEKFDPLRLVYVAGGGPWGNFGSKEWKDHLWSLQVTFLTPARLMHWALGASGASLKQIVFVGSAVCENRPEAFGASYSAAKHALLGLVQSVQAERPSLDVRLFSPGYMNTELLPMGAEPRHNGSKIHSKEKVAEVLWNWMLQADPQGYKVYS